MVRFNLPWDLVEEILSRVPATYLRGLQFTCKRWNALFKDPEFIKKHSDKAAKPPYSILLFSCSRVYSLSVNINNIAVTVGPTKLSRNPNESSEEVEITQVVHCNGLLLCSTKESNMAKLVVVNPCTGQARWIKPRSVYDMSDRYALGYENNNNQHSYASYKILRFPADGRSLLEIFELKSNSWRVLANIPLKGKQRGFGRGVSLKGNTYWLSCFLDDFEILSYDFATERFIILSFPFILPLRMSDSNTLALSVVREEQLSVLHLNLDTRQMEIWVSNKIDDDTETALSWSKSFDLIYTLTSILVF
ncbi:PREDICTED: F-box/LRR-repeat/kelch-repeat protein At2g27520-like [Camelina sativa]|uniref:F-box/LRR-repeat/kelch-repeat protein At2g27520-like n=1 Tax=Camelina sativa TaxID=90675 RepID=A0ABM0WQ45_CAMSA|nr:PREDICTED: F-box/LRR-repeat/kelch-repeat protein At2g27520-like [Camelina sativa]